MSGLVGEGTRRPAATCAGVAIGWPRVLHRGAASARGGSGSPLGLAVPSSWPNGRAQEGPA